MPLANDRVFQMRTSEEFLRAVDDWRRQQPDLPSRAEAIRRLVEAGLKASSKKSQVQGKGLSRTTLGRGT